MFRLVFIVVIISVICIGESFGSLGDRSPYFQKCLERCTLFNCTEDGTDYKDPTNQPMHLKLLQWTCPDECNYECMWGTVEGFENRKWRVPQFYGKWPFIRLWGIQEPASVLFSLMNLIIHCKMIMSLRRQVRKDSPLFKLWNFYASVNIHAWIWSTVFHARDTSFTEVMDYVGAFSIVTASFYCMGIRLLYENSSFSKVLFTAITAALFFNHAVYLNTGSFDYGYNMLLNIVLGTMTCILWFLWCLHKWKKQTYVWQCALFVTLVGLSTLLEILDFPPLFWTIDAHALWHMSTVPINIVFYRFLIDDCKFLRSSKETVLPHDSGYKKFR